MHYLTIAAHDKSLSIFKVLVTNLKSCKSFFASLFTALNEASLNPEPDYQNLVPDTTTAPVHESKNSNECAATYEELNQNTQDGTEYSTLDETLSE